MQELGVSSGEIDDIVGTCMELEIHAKLTGAGGGGCVICFPKDPDFAESEVKHELFKTFRERGYRVFDGVKTSQEGVTYEIV